MVSKNVTFEKGKHSGDQKVSKMISKNVTFEKETGLTNFVKDY